VPKIDYFHATILTAPLGCVIGRDGPARAMVNRTHALRGNVAIFRHPKLNLIEILWRFIKYYWLPFSAYTSF
jgi:hypothetical protein